MSDQVYCVYSAMDTEQNDQVALLTFTNGRLTKATSKPPAFWKGKTPWGDPFMAEVKAGLSPDEFVAGHTGLVLVPEGSEK